MKGSGRGVPLQQRAHLEADRRAFLRYNSRRTDTWADALRWLLQRPGVTAPIIGARSTVQLEENLGATGWTLSPEQIACLDAASATAVSHLYDDAAEQQ